MALTAGTSIGPYEIVGWLGAGAMGEVYRARDPRLGRDVAIKLIPESFAADRSRLHRFEQEARAAGQLNHPNILAVYDVGTHEGAPYIVSELLEGESLGSRLRGGALPSRKAIDYGRQIAEGLAAAHDKGIVHRDLKPDNLFITSEERVKILDFGIAKLTRPADDGTRATGAPTETADGMVVGTAGYMSPEQVRGEAVDARSDLFSFGAVLYEMLAGRPAFTRSTAAETVAAILKEDPTETFPIAVPPAIARILTRCLEKPREARFQSARDLAFALEGLPGTTGTAASAAGVAAPRARARRALTWLPWVAVAALAATLVVRESSRPVASGETALAHARFTRFTDWEGTEAGAEISPDGTLVAFVADRDGQPDLWIKQVGTGDFKNLTPDLPPLGPRSAGLLRTFGFSGDGQEIWFALPGSELVTIMPVTGGTRRAFLEERATAAAFSPDGNNVVYFKNLEDDPLWLADGAGAHARQLAITPPDARDWAGAADRLVHNHNPVWSPDNQWIYFAHGLVHELNWTDDMDAWRLPASGGSPERLTRQNAAVMFLAPLDARTVLYVARGQDGSGPWLWELDVARKVTRRLSVGLEQYTSVSASRDGRRVVVTVANPTASLWTVPILDRPAEEREAQPYPVTTTRALAPRFGGTSLFYLSTRGTGDGLWRSEDGHASEIWKGTDAALSEPAAVSRDGRHVAVVLRREGKQHLETMSADGTGLKALAPSIDVQGTADWSPDGTWIVAGGRDAAGPGLFRIPVDGGVPLRLVSGDAVDPVVSPDGTLIVYAGPLIGGVVPLRGVRPDGTAVDLPKVTVRAGACRFLQDGTGLVYLPHPQSVDFWRLDLVTGASRQLTRLGSRGTLRTFDITRDGKSIVFDRSRENSDIVLIDLPKR